MRVATGVSIGVPAFPVAVGALPPDENFAGPAEF